MKKLLPILFLLCSVAVFAEEEEQELPVERGGMSFPRDYSRTYLVTGDYHACNTLYLSYRQK